MYESDYIKILNSIRQHIKEGIWGPTQKLPDLEVLSRNYGVSIMAAEQALETLEKEGHILRKPGSGFFVNLSRNISGPILIIEDEPQNRALLREFVSSQGYDVLTAKDGYEAIRAIQKQDFNLVFLDLRLPGLHGIEILKKLKEVHPGIPVIIVSGFPDDILRLQSKADWPDMVISKPFQLSQIREALSMVKNRG